MATGQVFSDAAYSGNIPALEKLLAEGINIDVVDNDGFTALHRTCVTGNLDVIKFLLGRGANVNKEDLYGDSPMHYACFCGHLEAVQELLNAGADPTLASKDGKTPVESAREEGHEAIVRLLSQSAKRVGGLDFSHGVIVEGELRKKRANRVVQWRKKYYVLSKTYGAMFFWTGTRTTVEGVIKKVRFETFLSVRHQKHLKEGRRFDIRVVTGRTMELLASSRQEAEHWCKVIHEHLGQMMAVIRVQSAWRAYRARKELQRLIAQRKAAVKRLQAGRRKSLAPTGAPGAPTAGAAAGAGGAGAGGPPQIILEGNLKKRNTKSISRFLGQEFRTRYFVLSASDAALHYYESKAKRNMNVRPRSVPFLDFYAVDQIKDKKGKLTKRFTLRVVAGREFEFEGQDMADTEKWVTKLLSVLPRDNIAAVKIQAWWRMVIAVRNYKRMKAEKALRRQSTVQRYGKDEVVLNKHAARIQALARGRKARVQSTKLRAAKAEKDAAAAKAAAAKAAAAAATAAPPAPAKPLYLRKKEAGDVPPPPSSDSVNRLSRLRALRARQKPSDTGVSSMPAAPPMPPGAASSTSPWMKLMDDDSDRPYWHNPETGETTWEQPADWVDPSAPAPAAAAASSEPRSWNGWLEMVDPDSGSIYFVNEETQESSWTAPEGWEEHFAAAAAPAAAPAAAVPAETAGVAAGSADTETKTEAAPAAGGEGDAAAAAAGSAADWIAVVDPDSGSTYYVNQVTSESSWTKPPGWPEEEEEELHPDWIELVDPDSGMKYYVNKETSEAVWERPAPVSKSVGGTAVASSMFSAGAGIEEIAVGGSGAARADSDSEGEPDSDVEEESDDEEAGAGWKQVVSADMEVHYLHPKSGTTQTDVPEGYLALRRTAIGMDLDEFVAASAFFNFMLASNELTASYVPVNLSLDEPGLPAACKNGVALCALLNCVFHDAVDMRVVATGSGADGAGVSESAARDNLTLFLSSATSMGCAVSRITADQLASGDQPKAVGTAVFELMRRFVLRNLSVKTQPRLVATMSAQEELEDLLTLSPSDMLLKWANFHLAAAGATRLKDFSALSVAALALLLRSLCPEVGTDLPATESAAQSTDSLALASSVSAAMVAAGVPRLLTNASLVSASVDMRSIYAGLMYQFHPGLPDTAAATPAASTPSPTATTSPTAATKTATTAAAPAAAPRSVAATAAPAAGTASAKQVRQVVAELAGMLDDPDSSANREFRTFQYWINSLGIKDVFTHDLLQDVRDGVMLLKVLDFVEPGIVNWKRVNLNPSNKYKRIENCNLIIDLGTAMDFKLVGVSAIDLVNGTKKMVLAYVWQLMRYHTLKVLSSIAFNGFEADDNDILAWANNTLSEAGVSMSISSFHDPSLATGNYLLQLLNTVRPVVNWSLVTPGNTAEERMQNAKYIISIARTLGAIVFCTWEDLVEVQPKMIMMFIASLIQRGQAAARETQATAAASDDEDLDDGELSD